MASRFLEGVCASALEYDTVRSDRNFHHLRGTCSLHLQGKVLIFAECGVMQCIRNVGTCTHLSDCLVAHFRKQRTLLFQIYLYL
jgi:hypothetical protein